MKTDHIKSTLLDPELPDGKELDSDWSISILLSDFVSSVFLDGRYVKHGK